MSYTKPNSELMQYKNQQRGPNEIQLYYIKISRNSMNAKLHEVLLPGDSSYCRTDNDIKLFTRDKSILFALQQRIDLNVSVLDAELQLDANLSEFNSINEQHVQILIKSKYASKLILSRNKISQFQYITSSSIVEELNLSYNRMGECNIDKIIGLPRLQLLFMSNNNITKFASIKSSQSIEFIDLSNNEITRIDQIDSQCCPKLKKLILSGNQIVSCVTQQAQDFSTLIFLDISRNKIKSSKILTEALALQIQTLIASENDIPDLDLLKGGLQLKKLDLYKNKHSLYDYRKLQRFPQLNDLMITQSLEQSEVNRDQILMELPQLNTLNGLPTQKQSVLSDIAKTSKQRDMNTKVEYNKYITKQHQIQLQTINILSNQLRVRLYLNQKVDYLTKKNDNDFKTLKLCKNIVKSMLEVQKHLLQ